MLKLGIDIFKINKKAMARRVTNLKPGLIFA